MEKRNDIYKFSIIEIIWFIYFTGSYILGAYFKYAHYVLTFLLLGTMLYSSQKGKFSITKQYSGILICYTLFIVYTCFSICWAKEYIDTQKQMIISLIEIWILILCLGYYLKSKERFIKIILIFILSTVIMAFVYYITSPISTWGTTGMGTKLNIWRNAAGYYFLFALIFSLYLYYMGIKKKSLLWIAVILFIAAVGTGSRKIFIQLIMALMLFIFFQPNMVKILRYTLVGLIVFLIIGSIAIKIPEVQRIYSGRILPIFQGVNSTDSSTVVRSLLKQMAIELFLEHPFCGGGMECFKIYLEEQSNFLLRWNLDATYSHCNYTELLANYGIIGFLLYYFYPINIILKNLKFKDNLLVKLGLIIMISFLVLDYATISYSYKICMFVLIVGIECIKIGLKDENNNG